MKKWLIIATIMIVSLQAFAFEDVVVTADATLTDIKVKDTNIIDVYPLITVENKKNTLFFHPLKIGSTEVCVLKNDKDIVVFNVEVKENKTIIDSVKGFEILGLDLPPDMFEVDLPPQIMNKEEVN